MFRPLLQVSVRSPKPRVPPRFFGILQGILRCAEFVGAILYRNLEIETAGAQCVDIRGDGVQTAGDTHPDEDTDRCGNDKQDGVDHDQIALIVCDLFRQAVRGFDRMLADIPFDGIKEVNSLGGDIEPGLAANPLGVSCIQQCMKHFPPFDGFSTSGPCTVSPNNARCSLPAKLRNSSRKAPSAANFPY